MRDRRYACRAGDGRRRPIRAARRYEAPCARVDEDQEVVAAETDLVWSVGVKPVQRLSLASGRTLRATGQHRVLTGKGWLTLDEI